jgi:nicotinamide-nucleotide amidase
MVQGVADMRAEVLSIGTELLLGSIIDSNAAYVAEQLAAVGIDVVWKTTVGDDEGRIGEALRLALNRSEIVIATGGLGPTEDDMTCRAIAAVLARPVVRDDAVLEAIRRRFSDRGMVMPKNNERQALIPEGAVVLANLRGTAPGLLIRTGDGRVVVAMPGVPSEMRPMLTEQVIPRLREEVGVGPRIRSRVLKTCGIAESQLDTAIGDLMRSARNPSIGLRALPGEVHIRLTVRAESSDEAERRLDDLEAKLRVRLGDLLFGRDGDRLEEIAGRLLLEARQTVSVAESCTGGLVCHRLTNLAGSSAYFIRGDVVYSNESKETLLGVPHELIETYGAVSRVVAEAMASGMREAAGTDLALGVTGIAGPGGGSAGKPVGLTFIAIASAEGVSCREFRFLGDRETNKLLASQAALDLLRRRLLSHRDATPA